ncbi:MAG: hypothetical protein IJY87_02805 [Bacilli bacterium]|nr:hypothetical protein [Bacilli bacterium]
MKKTNEIIQRIERPYVGDGCVQFMAPYRKSLTVFDRSGITFHSMPGSKLEINRYIKDDRRKQFPYSTIPMHRERAGFSSVNYANQLFDFEEPYIRIGDGKVIESYVVPDGKEALMISNVMPTIERVQFMTREEVENLFRQPVDSNSRKYTMVIDTKLFRDDSAATSLFRTEEEIVEITQREIAKQIEAYRKNVVENEKGGIPYFEDYTLRCFEHYAENLTIEGIPGGIPLDIGKIIVLEVNNEEVTIQKISVQFMGPDYYAVNIVDMPVTKYTLEQLKFIATEISRIEEPKVPFLLNPNISRKRIRQAKAFANRKSMF